MLSVRHGADILVIVTSMSPLECSHGGVDLTFDALWELRCAHAYIVCMHWPCVGTGGCLETEAPRAVQPSCCCRTRLRSRGGQSADLFLTTLRGMPTANAEGQRGSEGGIERVAERRAFRCLQIDTPPRRSPSACAEMFQKNSALGHRSRARRRRRSSDGARAAPATSTSVATENESGNKTAILKITPRMEDGSHGTVP